MLSGTIAILTTTLISFIIGWIAKSYFNSNPQISKKEYENLKTENIELRSEIANLKSPANDIETLKSIINVHLSESEEKNKKILAYETQIKQWANINTTDNAEVNILLMKENKRDDKPTQ